MTLAFDLISDLHIDTWDQPLVWTGLATSPYCVVAGDVCRNRLDLVRVLRHLGECYRAVFYIDGNDEHVDHWHDLGASYQDLTRRIKRIPNLVYLQDNVVVIEGVGILATNGWWGFDFAPRANPALSSKWYQNKWDQPLNSSILQSISRQASFDATYLCNSVRRLQTHNDVRHIVMVTHTVPLPELIEHDIDLSGTHRFNCMGNSGMISCLGQDFERKINTWCFGHYHMPVDQVRHGVRFVNNCRGRGDSTYQQWAYQPRRIEIGD